MNSLALCVTTLGRLEALDTLLRSLRGQLASGDRLVIIAQARLAEVERVCGEHAPHIAAPITVASSERGASTGRNAAVALLEHPDDPLLMFPNDTTWFPEGSIAAIRRAMDGQDAGAVTVQTSSGPRFSLPPAGSPLDATTVWRVIEMGLVIRLSSFRTIGAFDPRIGSGAPSPWQAGEVTDLLMRALAIDPRLARRFVWIPADRATVGGIAETAGLDRRERRRKLRAYGRGVGWVFRSHDFPWWHRVRFLVAGLVIGVLRRQEYAIADGPQAFLGRFEGLTGRTFGEAHAAVTR